MAKSMMSDIELITSSDLPWHTLSGLRILVTGAGGFIGGYLTRLLLHLYHLGKVDKPIRVVAMTRNTVKARQYLLDVTDDPYLELIEWDLSQISVPNIGSCNYVIHAASQASPRFYSKDPVGTLLPNAVGTAALLKAMQHQSSDPRGFLFLSSSEVYGSVSDKSILNETDYGYLNPATVRACYAEGKRIGETLCVAWTRQYEIPTYIARPFHTYGPGLKSDDGRVFADFVFNVLRSENIVMISDGSARRAFCYISDAISGFFTVLLKGEPTIPYNVANPSGELSVMELAELLVSFFPERGLKIERHVTTKEHEYLQSSFSRLIPDITQLSALGWAPMVNPVQGFQRMIEAYAT